MMIAAVVLAAFIFLICAAIYLAFMVKWMALIMLVLACWGGVTYMVLNALRAGRRWYNGMYCER